MKKLALAAVFAMSSAAFAGKPSPDQIAKSKELPGTVITRTAKNNPKDVSVVHLKEKVKSGTRLTNLQFEKMALNAEKTGIAYDSTNELDARSSTSSWSFGLYYNPGYSYYRSYSPRYYNYGYYPSYNYYGYNYYYRPYYSYSDDYYDYNCYGWYY